MRQTTRIELLNISTGHYDPIERCEKNVVKKNKVVYGNVTNLNISKTQELFGSLEIDVKIVRLSASDVKTKEFNQLKIDNKNYLIIKQIITNNHLSLYIKEAIA